MDWGSLSYLEEGRVSKLSREERPRQDLGEGRWLELKLPVC